MFAHLIVKSPCTHVLPCFPDLNVGEYVRFSKKWKQVSMSGSQNTWQRGSAFVSKACQVQISIKSYKITAGAFLSISRIVFNLPKSWNDPINKSLVGSFGEKLKQACTLFILTLIGFGKISINNFQTLYNLRIYAFIKVSILIERQTFNYIRLIRKLKLTSSD